MEGFNKSKDLLEDQAKEEPTPSEKEAHDTAMAGILDGLGQCFHLEMDFKLAIDNFTEAIKKDPKNVDCLKNRAQCYYDMKHYELAIKDLETALNINPKTPNPKILYRMGLTFYAFIKYKKCIKTLKQALQHTRDVKDEVTYEADVYYHLGLSYCRL